METKMKSQDFLNNFLLKRKDAVYITGNEPPTTYKVTVDHNWCEKSGRTGLHINEQFSRRNDKGNRR